MVAYTVALKQGDIYWVEIKHWEVRGSEQDKTRPYLIVSRNHFNGGNIVLAVALSTSLEKACAQNIQIPEQEIIKDPDYSGPIEPSVALVMQMRSIDRVRIMEKMGRLTDAALDAVLLGIQYVLDIDDP